MDTLDTFVEQKVSTIFSCKYCDYFTSRRHNFERHSAHCTPKMDTLYPKMDTKSEQVSKYECVCGKKYKWSQGLSKHKRSCSQLTKTNEDMDLKVLASLVLEVVKQNKEMVMQHQANQELATKLVEICRTQQPQTLIQHNNNTFNLNVFLNETCKDAMNIMDFVDSLQLQLSDLEDVGKLGFVEGISNIIVKNLKALDVTERPIHCADKKREIIYIKDQDKWERESDHKSRMRKVIQRVANKNLKLLPKYKEEHPGCNYSESKYSDQYSKIIIESMMDSDIEKQNKIIKRIAREVLIEK